MKLLVLSDLHLEFRPFTLCVPAGVDAVLLAGDLCAPEYDGRLRQLLVAAGRVPTFYTPGNHEFYREEHARRRRELATICGEFDHVTFLDDTSATVGGYRLHGTTLWSDFGLYGTPDASMAVAQRAITDFELIWTGRELATASDLVRWNRAAVAALETTLALGRPTIVMSHFVPHPRSIHPRYANHPCNPYFCSDLSRLFRDPVVLWVHGHTHSSFDYIERGIRVVCNPRGYPGENACHFHAQLVVELP